MNALFRGVRTSVWILRALAALGPLVALWSAAPAGFVPSPFVVGVVALRLDRVRAAARALLRPRRDGRRAALVGAEGRLRDARGLAGAAAGLLAAHVAGVLLGYGPPTMPVDPDLTRLWAFRGAATWLAAPVVWFAADAYSGHATPTSFWLVGLATALVGAVVAAVVVPARDLPHRT